MRKCLYILFAFLFLIALALVVNGASFEISSKLDVFETYKAYKAFYRGEKKDKTKYIAKSNIFAIKLFFDEQIELREQLEQECAYAVSHLGG